jgi:hypothetical protein
MLLKMTTNKVAYLITYISYNCVYNTKGTIDELLLEQFLLDEVSEYIINNSCSTKFEFVDDVKKFWERYGGYNVWEAYCVKDNNWINMKPSNEDILLNIYEMTRSVEIFEDYILEENLDLEKNIFNLKKLSLEKNTDLEKKFDLEKKLDLEENLDLKENLDLEENLEIIDINDFYSSETNDSIDLFGENIEIDWNTIYIQEQEEQNEN